MVTGSIEARVLAGGHVRLLLWNNCDTKTRWGVSKDGGGLRRWWGSPKMGVSKDGGLLNPQLCDPFHRRNTILYKLLHSLPQLHFGGLIPRVQELCSTVSNQFGDALFDAPV